MTDIAVDKSTDLAKLVDLFFYHNDMGNDVGSA